VTEVVRGGRIGASLVDAGRICKKHKIRLVYISVKVEDGSNKIPEKNPITMVRIMENSETTKFTNTVLIFHTANAKYNHVEAAQLIT